MVSYLYATDLTSNTNSVLADNDELEAILPDMSNDLSSDLRLVGPFSSPVQTVVSDDDTVVYPILTISVLDSDNDNITSIEDNTTIPNEEQLTPHNTSINNIDESSSSLSDLIHNISHISFCEDELSIYELEPVNRQDHDLIFVSGFTYHMVFNFSLLTNVTYNDRIDMLNLDQYEWVMDHHFLSQVMEICDHFEKYCWYLVYNIITSPVECLLIMGSPYISSMIQLL